MPLYSNSRVMHTMQTKDSVFKIEICTAAVLIEVLSEVLREGLKAGNIISSLKPFGG